MFNNRTMRSWVARRSAGRITDDYLIDAGWQQLPADDEDDHVSELRLAVEDSMAEPLIHKKQVHFAEETREPSHRASRHFHRTSARYRPGKHAAPKDSAGHLNTSGPDHLLNRPACSMPVEFFKWRDEKTIRKWHRDAATDAADVTLAQAKRISRTLGLLPDDIRELSTLSTISRNF